MFKSSTTAFQNHSRSSVERRISSATLAMPCRSMKRFNRLRRMQWGEGFQTTSPPKSNRSIFRISRQHDRRRQTPCTVLQADLFGDRCHGAIGIYFPLGDPLDLCFQRIVRNLFCQLSENSLSQQREQFMPTQIESFSFIFAVLKARAPLLLDTLHQQVNPLIVSRGSGDDG